MQTLRENPLRWMARLLAILFIGFISLFALDVFAEGYSLAELLVALFMHLIPSFLLLIALIVAWRWPFEGGIIFLILGIASLFYFNTYQNFSSLLMITVPNFSIGILFILDAWFRNMPMRKQETAA